MHLIQYALIFEFLVTCPSSIPLFLDPLFSISYLLSPAAQAAYLAPPSITSSLPINPVIFLIARILSTAMLGILCTMVIAIPDASTVTIPGLGIRCVIGDVVTRRKVAYVALSFMEVGAIGLFVWEGAKIGEESVVNAAKAGMAVANLATFLAFRVWCFGVKPAVFEVGGANAKKRD